MHDGSGLAAFTEEDISVLLNDDAFLGVERYHAHAKPKAVLLAGQPGSGKTELSSMMTLALEGDAAFINGDDFRRYHPNYRKLFAQYGSDAVGMISPFSNAIVERMIEEFSDRRFNLVIEGTGRTAEVPRSTAELLSEKGYTVELAVIAARPEISLISTMLRFYQMNEQGTIPRATAITAHDAIVDVLPDNLDILWAVPNISRIAIWDREQQLLFDSCVDRSPPSSILRGYWEQEWSAEECEMVRALIERLRKMELRNRLGQTVVIEEIERRVTSAMQFKESAWGMEMKL